MQRQGDSMAGAARHSARLPVRSPGDAPASSLLAPAALAESLKSVDPSNIHVLVVGSLGSDESSPGCSDVVDILRQQYRVTVAASDNQALQLLRAGAPVDLILKEHEPPLCDAIKFIPRVMKSPAYRHIPIVVVSTRDDKVAVADALHCGAADYLVKPLRRDELGTMWAHVWRRWVGAQLSAAQAQAAAQQPGAGGQERQGGEGGSDESSGEGSGQGSVDEELDGKAQAEAPGRDGGAPARPTVTAADDISAAPLSHALQAAAVRTLPPVLEAPLFAAARVEPQAVVVPVQPAPAPVPAAVGHGQSAFLAYTTTPVQRPQSCALAEPESRPWPQDPAMAAAAAAVSMALAAGMGHPMAMHAAAAAGAPFGLGPFAPPFSLFPAGAAAAQAHAQAQAQAHAQAAAAHGLRPSSGAALREAGSSDGATAGCSGDADARARRATALKKFKEKRANRCFTKKIRYTSRKQLAEARPRNRGQFVRIVKSDAEPGHEEGAALLALAMA